MAGARAHVELAGQIDPAEANAARAEHDGGQEVHGAHEVGDEGAGRPAVHLGRRADLLDHALVHHHDAVGHRQRLFLVVRHHDGRDAEALCSGGSRCADTQRTRASSAESGSSSSSRPGEGASARARRRAAAGRPRAAPDTCGRIGHADQPQQVDHARVRSRPWARRADQAVADVVRDREVREQRIGLEDDAEIALRAGSVEMSLPA